MCFLELVPLVTETTCLHRKHWKLENLRTVSVSKNHLTSFEVVGGPPSKKGSRTSSGSSGRLVCHVVCLESESCRYSPFLHFW